MRITLIILSLICLALGRANAQSDLSLVLDKEGKIVAIPKPKPFELDIQDVSELDYTPKGSRPVDLQWLSFQPEEYTIHLERPMDMNILSGAYRPFYNVYTPMLIEVSPMALDFNETYLMKVNENVDFLANGSQYTWPGAGGMTIFTTVVSWHNDRLRITGGGFGGRFFTPLNPSPDVMAGLHLHVSYEATDWLKLHAWGDYVFYDQAQEKNAYLIMNPFFYHQQVGGALQFKVSDNFSFGVGANFQYNPARRGMERQIMIFPGFGGRDFGFGF